MMIGGGPVAQLGRAAGSSPLRVCRPKRDDRKELGETRRSGVQVPPGPPHNRGQGS